jgi:hypothetical protein
MSKSNIHKKLKDREILEKQMKSFKGLRERESNGSESRKAKNENYVYYPIKDTDSEIIVLLKKEINEAEITLQDIYNVMGSSQGYNLHYGLMNRNEIRLSSLEHWAKIINKRLIIKFKDIIK